jgi:hypothetical protein
MEADTVLPTRSRFEYTLSGGSSRWRAMLSSTIALAWWKTNRSMSFAVTRPASSNPWTTLGTADIVNMNTCGPFITSAAAPGSPRRHRARRRP